MAKNREQTEKKILDAVQQVLIDQGASNLGVNTIARKAGISKVLIYRYFESYEKLIYRYIELNNPFPKLKEKTFNYISDNQPTIKEAITYFFLELIDYTYENPGFKEILIWELAFSNEITQKIAESREESSRLMLESIYKIYPELNNPNFPGISSILTGGIFYLISRSKTVESFTGINIKEDKDSIKKSVKSIISHIFQ